MYKKSTSLQLRHLPGRSQAMVVNARV